MINLLHKHVLILAVIVFESVFSSGKYVIDHIYSVEKTQVQSDLNKFSKIYKKKKLILCFKFVRFLQFFVSCSQLLRKSLEN